MKFHYSNIPLFPMKEIIGETREMNRPEIVDLNRYLTNIKYQKSNIKITYQNVKIL